MKVPVPLTTDRSGRQTRLYARLRLLLAATALLGAAALYRNTASLRASRALQNASLQALQEITGREPYNRRAFYLLGLREQQLGDNDHASAALERAATLDTDDEAVWLAWAEQQSGAPHPAEAAHILTSFLTLHPDSAQVHLALARLYQRAQSYRKACTEAEAAARLQPRLAEPWKLIAIAADAVQDQPKAEAALRQALACAPRDAANAFELGRFLMRHDRFQEAAGHFRTAAELIPDQPIILLALGQALLKTAVTTPEIEAARAVLEQSAKLRPGHPETCLALCQSYLPQQRWREALAALEPLNKGPIDGLENQMQVAYQRTQMYGRLGSTAAAARERALHDRLLRLQETKAKCFDRIQQQPADPAPRLDLGRLCARCGDYDEADAVYRKLLEYVPDSQSARQELSALETAHAAAARSFSSASEVAPAVLIEDGDRLIAQKRFSEAKAAYLQVLGRDRKSARACQGVGLALAGEGDVENAFAYLQQALTLDAHLPLSERALAGLYLLAGFPNEAKRRLLQELQDAPGDAAGWHDLGLVYRAAGSDANKAEETFGRAVALAPDNPVYLLEYADALAEHSRTAQAETLYRRVLAAEPDNAAALARLGAFLLDTRPTESGQREAEPLLQRADKLEPENPFTLYNRGRLALLRHSERQAIGYLETALKERPDMAKGWYALAQARRAIGDSAGAKAAAARSHQLQEAFAVYTKVVEQVAAAPKQSNPRLQLARQHVLRGENAHAINQYQVCLRLDPQNRAAQKELAALTARLGAEERLPKMAFYNAMVNSFSKSSEPAVSSGKAEFDVSASKITVSKSTKGELPQ